MGKLPGLLSKTAISPNQQPVIHPRLQSPCFSVLRRLSFLLVALCLLAPVRAEEAIDTLPPDLHQRGEEALRIFEAGNRAEGLRAMIRLVAEGEKTLGENHPALTKIHNSVSVMFQNEREFESALLHADRALECAAGFGNPKHPRLLESKIYRAVCLQNLSRLEESEKTYTAALQDLREIGDARGEGEALVGRGTVLQAMGRYREGESDLLEVFELDERQPLPLGLISKALSVLGGFYTKLGDYERALHYQEQAIEIGQKAFGKGNTGLVDRFIGAAKSLRHLKRYEEAQSLLRDARKIVESTSPPGSLQFALLNGVESNIAADLGDYKRAIALELATMKISEDRAGPAFAGRDTSLNNLGMISALQGDYANAERWLPEALALTEQSNGKTSASAANCVINRSILAALQGNAKEAVSWLNDGNSRYEAILKAVSGLGLDGQKLVYLQQLSGKTHYAVTLHQKIFPNDDGARHAALLTILSRKGRAADLTRRAPMSAASNPNQVRRAQLLSEIANLALGTSPSRPGGAGERAWVLQEELEKLERKESDKTDASMSFDKVSIEAVRARLKTEEMLIEYVIYKPYRPEVPKAKEDTIPLQCAAYLLFADGTVKSADLGELEPIEAAVRALRAGLNQPDSDRHREPSRLLDKLIVEPLRKLSGGKKRWLISPDGALNLVPFGALLDESGKFLIESYDVSYLSSGRDLLRPPGTAEPGPALLVAAPDYDAKAKPSDTSAGPRSEAFHQMNFTPLPGTMAEVKSLSALLPNAHVEVGEKATETMLKRERTPRLLHIATHGFFLSDEPSFAGARGLKRVKQDAPKSDTAPSSRLSFFAMESPLVRSGLALSGANNLNSGGEDDGVLTALEVSGLDLRSTKMVVLSACETGIGQVVSGEGVYGLRRAFHLAGAESQVLSLWKVHDEATQQLMENFYTELTKGGARNASLRKAQLALLNGATYQHPAYWASFILSGEAGPL